MAEGSVGQEVMNYSWLVSRSETVITDNHLPPVKLLMKQLSKCCNNSVMSQFHHYQHHVIIYLLMLCLMWLSAWSTWVTHKQRGAVEIYVIMKYAFMYLYQIFFWWFCTRNIFYNILFIIVYFWHLHVRHYCIKMLYIIIFTLP